MAAVQETIDRVKAIDVDQYKYGFETDRRHGKGSEGPERGCHPLHLGQEGRAGVDAGLASRRVQALADDEGAGLGPGRLSEDRLQRHLLLRRPEDERGAEVARRGRSGDSLGLREARHPAA